VTRIFGDFVKHSEKSGEYLKLSFHPGSTSLQQRWRNNGLSADFLAGYLSTFFPGDDADSAERQSNIKDAISFIANELLENAMKYSYAASKDTVSIEMVLDAKKISIYTTNSCDPKLIEPFQALIGRLLTEDTSQLYIDQLENNTEDNGDSTSGLGFLTLSMTMVRPCHGSSPIR
jgi:hypothetical protein